jgi:predicted ATPase
MIQQLRLERFKGFRDATLDLAPFTVLVGANAAGKSNLRDAFRFLHGVGRGYALADIFGEKWSEAGELVWRGIRGGTREAVFEGGGSFVLTAQLRVPAPHRKRPVTLDYRIEVAVSTNGAGPRVEQESLHEEGHEPLFDSRWPSDPPPQPSAHAIRIRFDDPTKFGRKPVVEFASSRPVLAQMAEAGAGHERLRALAQAALDELRAMRFFEPMPEALRRPSFPGQVELGDRGENLSSVLQGLCAAPRVEAALVEWLQDLTPMDAARLEFPEDPSGRAILRLIERNGRGTTAYSASDGTLRFLAYLAILLDPQPPRLCFCEEIENGIHPARMRLLLDLIRRQTGTGRMQIVTSSHSSVLVGLLGPDHLSDLRLLYRPEEASDARIRPALSLPDAKRVLGSHSRAELHATGWFETAAEFIEDGGDA